ncbi:hypothetical protein KKF34_05820 [Myxococcota bacterium]|nr:hypothetical protein [Myxococcota bacterium]MBU1380267.1 hypothetical protein [Myxococcota bacterium]MBU1496380.1 hypothetical protein [Myxococcota bacterium]
MTDLEKYEGIVQKIADLSEFCRLSSRETPGRTYNKPEVEALSLMIRNEEALAMLSISMLAAVKSTKNIQGSASANDNPIAASDEMKQRLASIAKDADSTAGAVSDPLMSDVLKDISNALPLFEKEEMDIVGQWIRLIWVQCTICGGIFALAALFPPPYACRFCGAPYWHWIVL